MSLPEELKQAALEYHRHAPAGKIRVTPTKSLLTARDLSLAYSPGVAAACEAIVADAHTASDLTARGNLVGVITNGTAVLGLGDIGPLAGKPVMEGKAVLFRKFAGIDVFDIEIDERDPDKLIDIIAALEPTFGGINLEDIKAPECFIVERRLRERMKIPVFHDDQHGTAIIVGAALINALRVVGKNIEEVKLAHAGAGAAGIACLDMLVALGMKPENILAIDREGVLYSGRAGMDVDRARFARDTRARTLGEIVQDADVFLGLSAGGVLKPEMVASMAARPIILALANPTPEIMPGEARAVRDDCVIATGRSDYPNQVNNALCFPYIFRGALDVGATTINEAMKVACVRAIAELARREGSDIAARAYGGKPPHFGAEYLIPQPFAPRLLVQLAPAVAKAAMDSGVAARPIADLAAYTEKLVQFVFRTGLVMKPVFERAKHEPKRVVYAEGEEETVLRAVQTVVDEGLARPILIGRPEVIASHRARRPAVASRPRFRSVQHPFRPAFRRILAAVLRADAAARLYPGAGEVGGALAFQRDRRADGGARRRRRDDLRHGRPLPEEARPHPRHHRAGPRRLRAGGDDRDRQRQGRVFLPRHPRAGRSRRRTDRQRDAAGLAAAEAVRHRRAHRAALGVEFRQSRQRGHAQAA